MSFNYINEMTSPENLAKFADLVKVAAGAGQDVSNAFKVSDRFLGTKPMELCVRAVMSEPNSAQIVKEKYIGTEYDLDLMLAMPKHSLGWTYAKVISTMGYDPQFYPAAQPEMNDEEYVHFRVFKTHDIHHILTGFSLDNFGELGVISVTVAQSRFPGFLFIDLLSLLISFFASDKLTTETSLPEEEVRTLGYKFKLISQGIEMGISAKPLFPVKWEEYFEHPLDEVRKELNIIPATNGAYSWYSNPQIQEAMA